MQPRRATYSFSHVLSSIIMLLALAWLTISTPFVYNAQQEIEATTQQCTDSEADDFNPFSGTTEEKTEGGINSLSEEYLHDPHHFEHHFTTLVKYYKCHPSDEYIAFHPEFISPPPEA